MEIQATNYTAIQPNVFIPADVARAFRADFLDESVCRAWILTALHGEGPIQCPACRAEMEGVALQRFWEGKRVCCRRCGKFFTALTGTFLAGCHMSYAEVMLLAGFLSFGIQSRDIAKILNVSPETVRQWGKKFHALGKIRRVEGGNPGA